MAPAGDDGRVPARRAQGWLAMLNGAAAEFQTHGTPCLSELVHLHLLSTIVGLIATLAGPMRASKSAIYLARGIRFTSQGLRGGDRRPPVGDHARPRSLRSPRASVRRATTDLARGRKPPRRRSRKDRPG